MATFKAKLRPAAIAGREGTIYYQIIQNRAVKQIFTDYHVYSHEWVEERSTVAVKVGSDRGRMLLAIRDGMRRDIERLMRVDRRLSDAGMPYSADDLVDEDECYLWKCGLINYMETIISRLKCNGKVRTSETYRSALASFKRFMASKGMAKGTDLLMDCLTSELMEAYEAWLRGRGIALNTVSFYIRILRAVYNRAVEDGMIENRKPFRRVFTGIEKTVKRALPLPAIRRIKGLELTPKLGFARDMFLMSFCLRGMSFVDMAFLRKTDLRSGYVTYRRRKTGQLLTIAWTKEMQAILDRYPENRSDYLLPIIRSSGGNERSTYKNMAYTINRNLKKVAQMAGLRIPLTLYVARHSWASAARSKGIPLSVISEGMGHDSESTTQIYLASLDTSVVDKANSVILSGLWGR